MLPYELQSFPVSHMLSSPPCPGTSLTIFYSRLACWYYTDGNVLTDLIWTETLKELSFAGVEGILASMKPAQNV